MGWKSLGGAKYRAACAANNSFWMLRFVLISNCKNLELKVTLGTVDGGDCSKQWNNIHYNFHHRLAGLAGATGL